MEFIGPAIGVIIMIAIIVLIVKFVVFIFTNWFVSRILCFICCGISLISAFPCMSAIANGSTVTEGIGILCIIGTVFSWLFYIGPVVFDVEWDGTYSVTETSYGYEIKPNQTGGFIGNFVGALIIVFILYGAIGSEFPAIMLVVPGGIAILNFLQFRR